MNGVAVVLWLVFAVVLGVAVAWADAKPEALPDYVIRALERGQIGQTPREPSAAELRRRAA